LCHYYDAHNVTFT